MAKKTKYCYWSVCDGPYASLMERCVRTARKCGVFKDFNVLTDRPIAECECYDAYELDKSQGLFKLHYLKAGMTRLNYDYFIWLDADSVFAKNPLDVLEPMSRAPIHVPLEANLAGLSGERHWNGISLRRLRELMGRHGVANEAYWSRSAFWMIHHDAIEPVYDLAMGFWHKAKEEGALVDVDAALGYAMQMMCADPEIHRADLFYRLNVIPITIPPLRERLEDIPGLANFFLDQENGRTGHQVGGVRSDAIEALQAYSWPGNIRELKNVIKQVSLLAGDGPVSSDHIVACLPRESPRRGYERLGLERYVEMLLTAGEAGELSRVFDTIITSTGILVTL